MKLFPATAILFLSLFVACCCPKSPAPYLAVREQSHRWEHELPLNEQTSKSLLNFLQKGGDHDKDLVEPGAGSEFGPLLALLSTPANLTPEALQGEAFKPWFKTSSSQVIDAREPRPRALSSLFTAYEVGRYAWVFRPGPGDTFDRLTVFRLFWK